MSMAAAWYLQQRTGNSGWVDVTWSLGVGGIAAIAAVWPLGYDWPHWRQLIVAVLAASWCLRLGVHIAGRTRSSTDDPRYRNLIIRWGRAAPRRMFWFLQSQAAVGIILALSIVVAAHNPDPNLRIQDLIGLVILLAAIVGESIADHQLRAFKTDPANRKAVCDIGLWRWSRHPNYFFEWSSWLAYPIIAIDFAGQNPFGWLALTAPVCMAGRPAIMSRITIPRDTPPITRSVNTCQLVPIDAMGESMLRSSITFTCMNLLSQS